MNPLLPLLCLLFAGPTRSEDTLLFPDRTGDSATISPLYLLEGGKQFRVDTSQAPRTTQAEPPDTAHSVMFREFQDRMDSAEETGVRTLNEHYSKTGRTEQGIACYKRYLNANPYSNKARLGLGQLLGWSGRYAESIRHYEAVLQEDTANTTARMGLALVLGWDHQFNRAESLFRDLYTRNPADEEAKVNHARLMSWQNRWDDALRMLTEVLDGNPKNLYAHEAAGFIYKWKHAYRDAYYHFEAITRLEGDPEVLVNAHYQLAELDWWSGRTALAEKRLLTVARDHPEEVRFRRRADEIRDFLAWKFDVNLYRYQEKSRSGVSLTGTGNNGVLLSVNKNFNLAAGLKVRYHLRNETADRSSPIEDAVLFNVGAHTLHIEPEFRYKDSAVFHFFYEPDYYFNLRTSKPELDGSAIFQGAGFQGMVNTRKSRWYFGITRTPWVARNAERLWIMSRYTGAASALLFLPRQITLVPSVAFHGQEDDNLLQEYSLEAQKPLPWPTLEGRVRSFYKSYSDPVPDYFSYRHWAALEPGAVLRLNSLPWLTVSAEASAGLNWLHLGTERRWFGGFGLGVKPAARFGEKIRVRLEFSGRLNTDGYYLYYAGLGYGM